MQLETVTLIQLTSWRGGLGAELEGPVWVNPHRVLWIEPLLRSVSGTITGTRLVFGPDATIDVRELPNLVAGRLQGQLGDPGAEYIASLTRRVIDPR